MKTLFAFAFLLFIACPALADDALDKPLPEKTVTDWAADTVAEALTFSHDNLQDRFAIVEKDFTAEGWTAFRAFLNGKKIMQDVLQYRKKLATDVPDGAAATAAEVKNGRYQWTVVMVADVNGMLPPDDNGNQQVVPMNISVNVVRVPAAENRDGLKIATWELLPPPEDQLPPDMPVIPQQPAPDEPLPPEEE